MRTCFIYVNWGSDTDWMERYHTAKLCAFLQEPLPKILGSLNTFYEIQNGG